MKKQKFWNRGKKIFASILSASMLMTSVVPEAMVYGAEEDMTSEVGGVSQSDETFVDAEAAGFEAAPEEDQNGLTGNTEEEEDGNELAFFSSEEEGQAFVSSEEEAEELARKELIDSLNARIEKLPSVEEFQNLDKDEQNKVLDEVNDIADQYYDQLTEDEQAQVQADKLVEMLEYMSGQVDETESKKDKNEYMKYSTENTNKYSDSSESPWQSDEEYNAIDISGYKDDDWIEITYCGNGFVYKKEGFSNYDATVTCTPAFTADGRFIELTYKVTAKNDISGKLGVGAVGGIRYRIYDIDDVEMTVIRQNNEVIGFQLEDNKSWLKSGMCSQIYFGGVVSNPTTNYWVGEMQPWDNGKYNDPWTKHFFDQSQITEETKFPDKQIGFTMSWDVNLQKNEFAEYKILVGAGDKAELKQALNLGVKGKVDYQSETISGMSDGAYTITEGETTYSFTVNGGSLPLQGTDSNGTPYDFAGKTIVVKDSNEDEKTFEISSRPETPEAADISKAVYSTSDMSITIPSISSQEYIIVPVEKKEQLTSDMWTNYSVSGGYGDTITFYKDACGQELEPNKEYVVYTRVSATDNSLGSNVSEASGTLKIEKHTWKYNTIKDKDWNVVEVDIYCTDAECEHNEENPYKLTMTLNGDPQNTGKVTYTGDEYRLSLDEEIMNATDITFDSSVGIKYFSEDKSEYLKTDYVKDAGEYFARAYLWLGDISNDNLISMKKTFTIEPASGEEAGRKISNPDKLSREYDGEGVEAEYSSNTKNDFPTTVVYKKKGASDYTKEVPVDAGTYEVKASFPACGNYGASDVIDEFTIFPKTLTATCWFQKEYDGTLAFNEDGIDVWVYTGIDGQHLSIDGLTGTLKDKNVGRNKEIELDDRNVTVTGSDGTNPDNYKITYLVEVASVYEKELEATVEVSKEYDGKTETSVKATVDTGIKGESLEITGVTGEFADKNVGNDKTVSIDASNAVVTSSDVAKNYEIEYPSTATGTILPKPVQLNWLNTDLTYTGEEQSVTAEVKNAVDGDEFALTYDTNKATAVGKYTAKVTGLGNKNYTLTGATTDWSISYLSVEDKNLPAPTGTKAEGNEWYTGDVTLTPGKGYSISTDGENWSDTLTISDDGKNKVTYYLKDEAGHITEAKEITVKKDATAPTAEIKAGDSSIAASDKETSRFFKDSVEVQISGKDATSGVAKVEYQIVSKAKGEEYKEDGKWTEGNAEGTTLKIDASENCVVYARITDAAGNATILHTDALVVYKEVTGSGKAEYTRTTGQDMVTDIAVNGNTVKEVKYGDKVLAKDTDYVVNEDGKLVIRSEYLEKLPAGEHELKVSWNPSGASLGEAENPVLDSTIKVSVKRADSAKAETKITNADKLSKTYDGQPAQKVASESKNSSTPIVEYKKKDASDDTYTTEVPKNAGSYVVRVTYSQDENYDEAVVTKEFTIAPKAVDLKWSETDLIYTGKEQSVTAEVTNAAEGDKFTLIYKNETDKNTTNIATAAGNYKAEVTGLGNANYTLTGATTDWSISYLPVEDKNLPAPTGEKAEGNEWYTGDVTLTPGNGYSISTDGENWSDTLTISADGENKVTYYLKDEAGHITEAKEITVKKDATAPTAEIKAGDSSIAASDKENTRFFKDSVEVQLGGKDATSGVAKVEYQIVSKAKGEEYKEDGKWTEGNAEGTTLKIDASENCVVYARITDEAGNVTILHTDALVVYKEVTGKEESSYTRTTGEDMVTDLDQKGNTIKEVRNGDTVLTKDVDYVVNEDGKLVIRSEYLEKLPAGDHELKVSWNPSGASLGEAAENPIPDSTIKVSVKRADPAKAEVKITNTGKFSKTYDGQPAEKVTAESKNSSTPVVEYKKKDASDDTYTTEVPKDAGSYVVRVTYPQNENYDAAVVTEEFTIAPIEIGIQWSNTAFVYNGNQQVPTATATGLLGTDQCEITVEGAQTEAGKYTATAVSLSNPNYCLPKSGTTTEFEIKEAFDEKESVLALNEGLKVSQTGSQLNIKWGKVKGADGYNVYVQYCGEKFNAKSLKQVKSGSSLTVKKVNGKKLNLKKNYKIYVEAYKIVGDQTLIMGRSITAHIVGRQNSKYTNVKAIKLKKSSFTLKRGKSAVIKATTVKVYPKRKQLSNGHAKELRYATSNASVATVNANGKISAVGKGSCTIYVYARNGYTKKVKVTVK